MASAEEERHGRSASTDPAAPLRVALLWVMLAASATTLIELWLLEHYEDAWQYAPIVLLLVTLAAAGTFAARATRATLLSLRAVSTASLVFGLAGLVLHYRGNVEFELEMYPHLEGFELFMEAMGGATPVLAPAGMLFIGLLGLLLAWRHPAGRRR